MEHRGARKRMEEEEEVGMQKEIADRKRRKKTQIETHVDITEEGGGRGEERDGGGERGVGDAIAIADSNRKLKKPMEITRGGGWTEEGGRWGVGGRRRRGRGQCK